MLSDCTLERLAAAPIALCDHAGHAIRASTPSCFPRKSAISPTTSGASSSSSAAARRRVAGRRVLAAARRLRDRRRGGDRGRSAGRRPGGACASWSRATCVLIAGEKAPRRGARRVELSPGRARLRPLRARRPPHARRATRPGARARSSTASCASSLPKIAERRGRADRDRRSRRRAAAARDAHPLHRRHRRPARAASSCGTGLPALVDHHQIDLVIANAENAAAGFGITREIGDQLLELGRRRDDLRQSHLGQEGSARLHRRRAAAAAAGELPRRRARARQLPRAHRATDVSVGVDQRHGPRVHAAASTTRSPSCCARSRRCSSGRGSSSSTSTPRRRRRRSRWAGISTARSPPSSARTRTCRPPTSGSCPKGTAYLTDVGMTGPHDSIIGVEIERGARPLPHRRCRHDSRPRPATRG